MYAVTFFSVGCGVAAGDAGACALEDGTPYCGATVGDGWRGWAGRVGMKASETPKIARRTKTALNLWFAEFVANFPPHAILEPGRNVALFCFEWVTAISTYRPEPGRNAAEQTDSSRKAP